MPSDEKPECLNNRNKVKNDLLQEISVGCCEPKPKLIHSNTAKPKPPTADESCCKVPVADAPPACPDRCTGKCSRHKEIPKICAEDCTGKCSSHKGSMKSKTILKSPSKERSPKKHNCGVSNTTPMRKALSDLNDAASFEKNCVERMKELTTTQEKLTEQIKKLEEQEKKGVGLLNQADSMWSCMEEQYKKRVDDAKERTKTLQKELQELDAEKARFRNAKKDLEFKVKTLDKNSQEIKEKTIQKENDIKILTMEIDGFKKRIASNAKDLETAKNSYKSKREASDEKLKKLNFEMQIFQNKINDECQCKENKEDEGSGYVKEAREDLQKICRCLLEKKLENEDLRAEKDAILQEINLLKATTDTCSERCAKRQKNICEETKRIDKEIANCQVKCIQCHRHTDSADLTGFCNDCPRCAVKRECMVKGDECSTDHTKDCICTRVKAKFLDNVFENMYSVLEKQAKTCYGKEVADCVFTCLERSTNGKVDEATRKILQDFILSTVKKNITLTIIGGAVKTRCEMDPDTYGQLMLCLKDVSVPKPVIKVDKATPAKKPPCSRWKATSECNCPRGPKNCPCTKKAPKPPKEPGTCPESYEDDDDDLLRKRRPCDEKSCPICPFGVNMRAAQCMLGPEVLSRAQAFASRHAPPVIPGATFTDTNASCICEEKIVNSCDDIDEVEQSRYRMIEGVMGRYSEVPTIEEMQFTSGTSYQFIKENNKFKSAFSRIPSDRRPTVAAYAAVSTNVRPSSFLQNSIILSDQENTLEDMTKYNMLNQNDTNEQIQQKYENDQVKDQFTELALTLSGKLASDSEEHTVSKIEQLSITDIELLKSIETTSSGVHFFVNKTVTENSHLEGTWSETRTTQLDIHTNIIKLRSESLPLVFKNSSVKFLHKNIQSNSKELSLKNLDTILYPNDKEEKEKVNTEVGEEAIKDETDCPTKKEVSCSATTQLVESNKRCNDPYTSVRAQIDLFSSDIIAQQCCSYKSEDPFPVNTNAKQMGEVSTQSTTNESEITELYKAVCDLTAPKNTFKSAKQCLQYDYCLKSKPRPQLNSNDGVCNQLLEKIELWQAHAQQPKEIINETNVEEPTSTNIPQVWDALNYLPLQLPHFLKPIEF